jgi:hypothetical protein
MAVTINASTSAGLVQTADTSGVLQLQTNSGTTALTIDTSQNVGIGTASPSTYGKLALAGASSSPITFGIDNTTASTNTGGTKIGFTYGTAAVGYILNQFDGADFNTSIQANQQLRFLTGTSGGTERMRIDSSGNIYAGGTTTLSAGPYRYNSISNFSIAYGLGIQDTSAGAGGYFIGFLNQSNVVQGSISKTSSTVTAYNTGSDYRLKEDILSMTGALDRIAQLKPVTFKWKEDKLDGEGFIAHELAEVCPQCVTGEKDAVDTQGNPRYQMVDTSFLVATLTAAIQEQQIIINSLKARITALEGAA